MGSLRLPLRAIKAIKDACRAHTGCGCCSLDRREQKTALLRAVKIVKAEFLDSRADEQDILRLSPSERYPGPASCDRRPASEGSQRAPSER